MTDQTPGQPEAPVARQLWQCPLCHNTSRGKKHGGYQCCEGCYTEICVGRANITNPSALLEVMEMLRDAMDEDPVPLYVELDAERLKFLLAKLEGRDD